MRTALLSIWGLVTLVLVFTVSLLFYEMAQQGQSPLTMALGSKAATTGVSNTASVSQESYEIQVYFASRTTSTLLPESHRMPISNNTVENCRNAMAFLIDGPNVPTLAPILSNKTAIRGMYLLDNGELVIDFSRDLEAGHVKSASAEMLMVQGISKTLFQPILTGVNDLPVRRIRFLFEGSPYQQSFPAHIDLSNPIFPNRRAQSPAGSISGNG